MSHGPMERQDGGEYEALVDKEHMEWIVDWQVSHGASLVDPAFDALKALEEMLELCFKAGATQFQVMQVVNAERSKAAGRNEDLGEFDRVGVEGEVGDVLVCMAVLTYKLGIRSGPALAGTITRIQSRQWAPDAGGILRRPRDLNGN